MIVAIDLNKLDEKCQTEVKILEKVKIAIIGVNRLGLQHAENITYRIPNAELSALCDLKFDHVKEVGRNLGVDKVFDSYEKMLTEIETDAVLIATPPAVHRECILAACEAKKHIFCEKPIGVTDEDLDLIDEAVAKNSGKVLQVGFVAKI